MAAQATRWSQFARRRLVSRDGQIVATRRENVVGRRRRTTQKNPLAALAILIGAALLGSPNASSQDQQSAQQLPRAAEIPGVKPEVLAKAEIPDVPGRLLIVSRTTYQPGAR